MRTLLVGIVRKVLPRGVYGYMVRQRNMFKCWLNYQSDFRRFWHYSHTETGGDANALEAEILLDHDVAVRSNLKILLDLGSEQNISEVYAKVISQEALEQPSLGVKARLEFTWLPEDVKSIIEKRCFNDF